jgi:dihydrofolate reductase
MIRQIVAIDRMNGIAKHGYQPWSIPDDEYYFMDQTKGGTVLMGSKTFEVISHPLRERRNVVATRDISYSANGAEVIHDLDAFFEHEKDVWVIGGGQIFAATIDVCDELYVTEIDADFACDTFYPEIPAAFHRAETGDWQEQNGFRFRYCRYVRPSTTT